jgi:ribosome-binding protein aMBF1 (putative translation factor)
MAQVIQALCDICGGSTDVHVITVVWDGDRRPWEADICRDCYRDKCSDLVGKSRKAGRSNVRKPHTFEKLPDDKFTL